jgi:hypothetical protein
MRGACQVFFSGAVTLTFCNVNGNSNDSSSTDGIKFE